jgi:hypothetical protein
MKRKYLAAIMVFTNLALMGCGHDYSSAPPPPIVTQIFSDSAIDGDILVPFGSPISSGIITEGMTLTIQSVFAGIDSTGNEYRAFLDFPLGGQNGVPLNASIVSATLDIVIDSVSVSPGAAIPIRVDLVSFPPPLIVTDFDRNSLTPLASVIGPLITSADVNNHVFIDVTPLMVEAQIQAVPNFQIRLLEDFGPPVPLPGLIEINDATGGNRAALAPLLQVEYF